MPAATPKVLRVGTLTAIRTLDPHRAHDFTGHVVISQVYESPYARVGGRFEPRLVVGAPVRRDAMRYELELRPNLRFSDGSPVTANDLATSIQPAVGAHGVTVSAAGGRVVLHALTWRHRPEELLAAVGAKLTKRVGAAVLGTGPFAVERAGPDGIRLVPNPHAASRPRLDAIEIRWYPPSADGRPDALLSAVERGEVDFTLSFARDDVGGLQRVRKLFQPGMSTAFLAINTRVPHLADPRIRRALAMGIDRLRLTELCYANPVAFVARSLIPPALGRGNDGLRHEPEEARNRLQAASLPPLRMIRVWGPRPYLARPDAVAGGIVQQLRALGVTVEVVASRDSEEFAALVETGRYDLVLGGWFADTPDPVDYLESTLGSGGIVGTGQVPVATSNYAQWSDAEVDRLLAEARTGVGTAAIDDILARVATLVPLVPLMHGPRVIVHAWRVKGYDADAGVFPDFAAIDLED